MSTDLKSHMENYVRGSGRMAMGQKCDKDVRTRIAGIVIWRVSQIFITDKYINEFIRKAGMLANDIIYENWQKAFGDAVDKEFDTTELDPSDDPHRKAAFIHMKYPFTGGP